MLNPYYESGEGKHKYDAFISAVEGCNSDVKFCSIRFHGIKQRIRGAKFGKVSKIMLLVEIRDEPLQLNFDRKTNALISSEHLLAANEVITRWKQDCAEILKMCVGGN